MIVEIDFLINDVCFQTRIFIRFYHVDDFFIELLYYCFELRVREFQFLEVSTYHLDFDLFLIRVDVDCKFFLISFTKSIRNLLNVFIDLFAALARLILTLILHCNLSRFLIVAQSNRHYREENSKHYVKNEKDITTLKDGEKRAIKRIKCQEKSLKF